MNSVCIAGSVTFISKPQETKNGNKMISIGLMTKRIVAGKEYFDYFEITCYGHLVEYTLKNIVEHDFIMVQGIIGQRKATDKKTGVEYYKYVIYASDIDAVTKTEKSAQNANTSDGYIDFSNTTDEERKKIFGNNTVEDEDLPF